MSVIDLLLKIAGEDNFQLDPDIDTGYILRQCWSKCGGDKEVPR